MSPVNEVDHQLTTRDEILHQLKANLRAANNRMQQVAIRKDKMLNFKKEIGYFLNSIPIANTLSLDEHFKN